MLVPKQRIQMMNSNLGNLTQNAFTLKPLSIMEILECIGCPWDSQCESVGKCIADDGKE